MRWPWQKKPQNAVTPLDSQGLLDLIQQGGQASVERISTVNTCVRILSQSIAVMPLELIKFSGDGTTEKATNHHLYDLLKHQPNEWMTAYDFWRYKVRSMLLKGNGYSSKTIVSGQVRELIPIAPNNVTPVQDERFRVTYKLPKGRVAQAKQILHIRDESDDCLIGLSRIKQNIGSLNIAANAEKWGEEVFKTHGVAPGYLFTEKDTKKEQRDEIRSAWKGLTNIDSEEKGVPILWGGLEWKTININLEDAQFLETRKFQREDICGMFGVPPHMAQYYEKTTSWGTGIEQVSLQFATFSLMPIARCIEQRLENSLLTRKERKDHQIRFNMNVVLRADMKARAEFYSKSLLMGWMCINEVRRLEKLNPIEGGNVYRVPSNTESIEENAARDAEDQVGNILTNSGNSEEDDKS